MGPPHRCRIAIGGPRALPPPERLFDGDCEVQIAVVSSKETSCHFTLAWSSEGVVSYLSRTTYRTSVNNIVARRLLIQRRLVYDTNDLGPKKQLIGSFGHPANTLQLAQPRSPWAHPLMSPRIRVAATPRKALARGSIIVSATGELTLEATTKGLLTGEETHAYNSISYMKSKSRHIYEFPFSPTLRQMTSTPGGFRWRSLSLAFNYVGRTTSRPSYRLARSMIAVRHAWWEDSWRHHPRWGRHRSGPPTILRRLER